MKNTPTSQPFALRIARLVGCAAIVSTCLLSVSSAVAQTYLVNDTMTDTDRIHGANGSSTSTSSPVIVSGDITSTNTQWVVNSAGQMVASSTGELWTMNSTSSRMAIGYFPLVTIGSTATTITLNFTTGAMGSTAGNLRIALVDSRANGFRATDGFSSTDASYNGDVGYGVFSGSSTVGGGNTTNLSLNAYERTTTTSTDLLGTAGNWTSLASSSGMTGYFQANTSYALSFTLSYDASTLSMTTAITGGNFSNASFLTTDSTSPTVNFDALALRFGSGSNQFANVNLTSFTVSQVSAVPEPSTYAALVGAASLGLVILRRRRRAQLAA